MDVRREAGDDDPALGVGEHLLEVGSNPGLTRREAGAIGVGRIPAEQENAVTAQLGQA